MKALKQLKVPSLSSGDQSVVWSLPRLNTTPSSIFFKTIATLKGMTKPRSDLGVERPTIIFMSSEVFSTTAVRRPTESHVCGSRFHNQRQIDNEYWIPAMLLLKVRRSVQDMHALLALLSTVGWSFNWMVHPSACWTITIILQEVILQGTRHMRR